MQFCNNGPRLPYSYLILPDFLRSSRSSQFFESGQSFLCSGIAGILLQGREHSNRHAPPPFDFRHHVHVCQAAAGRGYPVFRMPAAMALIEREITRRNRSSWPGARACFSRLTWITLSGSR